MRVGHFIPQYYPYFGGAEVCVHNVCRKLLEMGHAALVVTTTRAGASPPSIPYPVERLFSRTCSLLRRGWAPAAWYLRFRVSTLHRRHRVDVWQVTNGYPAGAHLAPWFRKTRTPCVLRCCGEDIQRMPEIGYGVRLEPRADHLARTRYPLFDGFVALTPSVMQEYLELGISPERVRVIPNGVDTAEFATPETPRELVRQSLGVPSDALLILTVGRHHPKKGYELIPRIAAELGRRGLKFRWVVAGENVGKMLAKEPRLPELGVQPVEDFAKCEARTLSLPSPRLISLYRAADVFAFPTLLETFGMVLVEAMAAHLPIVTTDAEGVRHVVRHGQTGLQAPAGDAEAFAELLSQVLAGADLRRRLAEAAGAAAAGYDWKNVTAQYVDFYQEVAGRARGVRR